MGSSRVEASVAALATSLAERFDALSIWLEIPEPPWSTRPQPGSWSVREILEHLALMHRYVLMLVDKIGERCRRRVAAGAALPAALDELVELEQLARRERSWTHPEHMTPTGRAGRDELRTELSGQRRRCLEWLALLPRGEGALHSIRMSVVGRRLDLYGYLRLVDAHLARHLRQLERTRTLLNRGGREGPSGPAPSGP